MPDQIAGTQSRNAAAPDIGFAEFAPVGPGTVAGNYLRRYWQPICPGRDVPVGKARPARLLGEDFTVYRSAVGKPYVVAARCPHRRAQLWLGAVEGDAIRCFYHGWKFDGAGQCLDRPAEDAAANKGVCIAAYPTEEYLGLIFVYLGPAPAPPLPRYPIHDEPGRRFLLVSHKADYNYYQSLENLVDPVHAAFAHRSFFDKTGAPLAACRAERTSWGVTVSRAGVGQGVSHFGMPNVFQISGALATPDAHSSVWVVPIDDQRHWFYSVRSTLSDGPNVNFDGRNEQMLDSSWLGRLARAILDGEGRIEDHEDKLLPFQYQLLQDFVVQGSQGTIADRSRERLGRSDKAIALLRRLWRAELQAVAKGAPLTEWHWSPDMASPDWKWQEAER
jgi:5,5'-dehydrodivanillate O-demethylase